MSDEGFDEGAHEAPDVPRRPNALVRLYRGETSFDFVGRRRWWYGISGTIILAGVISLAVHGLNLGIDFKGGTSWEVKTSASVTQVQSAMRADGITTATVQKLGSQFIQVQADLNNLKPAQQSAKKEAVRKTLAQIGHIPEAQVSINDVGPTWGSTVSYSAIKAMVVFFILVAVVISFLFEWRMAVAALLKVVLHDLAITVGIFSLTNFQVTPDGVIAVLTIMGYSLYDTVVVFDRINENTKNIGVKRFTYAEMVNLSLNQVLARSLNTTLVAVLPVLSVLVIGAQILGATTLQQFGFPLAVGLVAGAYSSIFIAAPIPRAARERDAQKLAKRQREADLITPKAAATMLAGPGGAPERAARRPGAGAGTAQTGRRSGGVITPGSARRASGGGTTVVEGSAGEGDDAGAVLPSESVPTGSAPIAGGPVARPRKKKRKR